MDDSIDDENEVDGSSNFKTSESTLVKTIIHYFELMKLKLTNDISSVVIVIRQLRQYSFFDKFFNTLELHFVIFAILLVKGLLDFNKLAFKFIFITGTLSFQNVLIISEVTKRDNRNLRRVAMIFGNLVSCFLFIRYFYGPSEFCYEVIWSKPLSNPEPLTFPNLLEIIFVTNCLTKLITMICKILMILLPSKILIFRKRGKYYHFIELTSNLYYSIIIIQPWISYLGEIYDGFYKIVGIVFSCIYLLDKFRSVLVLFNFWKESLRALMRNVTFDPISENVYVDSMCSICRDNYEEPTMLKCKHVFCDECIVRWVEETSQVCPMCRHPIDYSVRWINGETSMYI